MAKMRWQVEKAFAVTCRMCLKKTGRFAQCLKQQKKANAGAEKLKAQV